MSESVELHVRRHRSFGWWSLLVFLSLGLLLESLHGFKVPWYLDVHNETRRLVWRLAHAHGGLLALIHIGFAATLATLPGASAGWRRIASPCLIGASILLPGGFFLGGLVVYGGDPGPGILLSPLGGALLLAGVGLTAWGVQRDSSAGGA